MPVIENEYGYKISPEGKEKLNKINEFYAKAKIDPNSNNNSSYARNINEIVNGILETIKNNSGSAPDYIPKGIPFY